ncbi:MAG: hypothetical protein IJW63_10165 [Lachnospiraceae bacterium]|nr:hypothetical protein [Lachnospiraceae bacterium]
MQVFKNKTFKRIFALLSFVFIFCVTYYVITDQLSSTTYGTYFQKDIEEIKANEEEVGLIFFGASRLYHAMVPSIFEEKMGYENVLVAATATQPLSGTYYYMKELVETVKPERIVIDVTFDRLLNEDTVQPCLLVNDRLSLKNSIPFVFNCIEPSDWKYLFGPCRYRDNILMYSLIKAEKDRIKAQNGDMFDPASDYYADKGFVYTYNSYATGTVPFVHNTMYDFSVDAILADNVYYLDKCIELCKANGIEVSLVTVPGTISYLYLINGYEDSVAWFEEYAEKKDISYHNLDYLKGREEILPDEYMYNTTHTNAKGAEVISEIYSDILIKESQGEDVSDYFYSDFTELKANIHRIAAVSGMITFTEEMEDSKVVANINIRSLQNETVSPQYQVELIDLEGNVTVLVEWTQATEAKLLLPVGVNYSVKVRAKSGIDGDLEAYQIYHY